MPPCSLFELTAIHADMFTSSMSSCKYFFFSVAKLKQVMILFVSSLMDVKVSAGDIILLMCWGWWWSLWVLRCNVGTLWPLSLPVVWESVLPHVVQRKVLQNSSREKKKKGFGWFWMLCSHSTELWSNLWYRHCSD